MASITRFLALAGLLVVACANPPGARECATGITCPEGTKCAAAQQVCITNNCGDGVVQSTEKCDDGNIIDGDGCAANCLSKELCGDGIINAAAGELCDDSNTLGGDGCAADCKSVEVCGNMIRDVGEACDDGNTVPGDGCSGNCKSTEVCGNGIVDINEKCDDGGALGGCNDDCQGGTGCGDGAIDKDGSGNPLEECDDGNTDNQDDCTNTCRLDHCGDGIIQTSGTRIEQCDPAVNFGETTNCNIDCTSASCGDGKVNVTRGEQCDDQNAVDQDSCKNNCTVNVCGDGVPGGPNEACDTGGPSATCDFDCTIPTCGDGIVNVLFGEECDSSGADTATCDHNCTIPICGDGTFNMAAGEMCDDGNTVNGDNCRNDCRPNVCGDSFVDTQTPSVEVCDDGNTTTEGECPYGTQSCTLCRADCGATLALTGNVCGDKVVHSPEEVCDDGNRTTESSCPYGQATCTNLCSADCKMSLSLSGPYCGDGITQTASSEGCDDHNNLACGTCDATCNMFASAQATGYIVMVPGAKLKDAETVTIGDGTTSVVFEFDNDNMTTGTKVTFGNNDDAGAMATKLKNAINGSSLTITAANVGGSVTLTHQRKSTVGNVAMTETVMDADFVVSGMAGGAGGNCPATTGCNTADDCLSGTCTNNVCQ